MTAVHEFTQSVGRTIAAVSVLTLGIVAVVSAQMGTSPSPPRDSIEQLVAEVRGLRAEIRQAADTSMRAQLLVARLQLQEQRITSLSRQLSDAQRQLAENERGRSALAGQMAIFERDDETRSADEREGLELVVGPLRAQLKLMDKADGDLQAQQTYLTGLIAEEQSRWTTFNAMLDELSKSVEVRTPR
jgi:chromosome segregation ATPase